MAHRPVKIRWTSIHGPDSISDATPFQDGTSARNNANESAYLVDQPGILASPSNIRPLFSPAPKLARIKLFDFQEGDNVFGTGKTGRFNRLIDEDHGQTDSS